MESKSFGALIRLSLKSNAVPDTGLAASSLRVELTEDVQSFRAWVAEISVVGELPWYKGEERCVSVRIMSQQFQEYVCSKRPKLFVLRGGEIVGDMTFDARS